MAENRVFICGAGMLIGKLEASSEKIFTICDDDYEPLLTSTQLRSMDRISKLALASALLALKDSTILIEKGTQNDYGLFLGTEYSALCSIHSFDMISVEKGALCVNPIHFPNTVLNSPACQVGIQLSIAGPVFTVCNGLNSGLDAIGLGYCHIRSGLSSMILAGGVDEFSELHSMIHKTFMPVSETSAFVLLKGGGVFDDKLLNTMAEVIGYNSLTFIGENISVDKKFAWIGEWINEALISSDIDRKGIGSINICSNFNEADNMEVIQEINKGLGYNGFSQCFDVDHMSACGVLQTIQACKSCCNLLEDKSKAIIVNVNEERISLLMLDVLTSRFRT